MPAEKKGIDFSSGKTEKKKNLLCSQKVHAYVFPSRKTYVKTICSLFPLPGMRRGFRNYVTSLIPHAREREKKNPGEYAYFCSVGGGGGGGKGEGKKEEFSITQKDMAGRTKKISFSLFPSVYVHGSPHSICLSAWVLLIIFDLHMQIRGVLARRGRKGGGGGGGREQGFYHSRNALAR